MEDQELRQVLALLKMVLERLNTVAENLAGEVAGLHSMMATLTERLHELATAMSRFASGPKPPWH